MISKGYLIVFKAYRTMFKAYHTMFKAYHTISKGPGVLYEWINTNYLNQATQTESETPAPEEISHEDMIVHKNMSL